MSETGSGDKAGDIKEDKKSVDKLKIEDEEKEEMIEKRPSGGEVEKKKKALEEAATANEDKRRIPIGGIKIPGFLRSTKAKTKENEETEENTDLLEPVSENKANSAVEDKDKEAQPRPSFLPLLNNLKNNVPSFFKWKKVSNSEETADEGTRPEGQEEEPRRPKLINAIRLPLASLVPKKAKKDENDSKTQAGLASMETLDEKHIDDGMENIRLDSVEMDPEKAALEEEESKWSSFDWKKLWTLAINHKLTSCGILVFLILLIILIGAVIFGPKVQTHAPVKNGKYIEAVTSCGLVEGVLEDGAFAFRGIPFARPPVGELRFRPPQSFTLDDCWNGTLKAHNVTMGCWQVYNNGSINGQENCLTLDIFTPAVRYESPMPVIFMISSESLMGGSPYKLNPTAAHAKLKDVVLVRPNFRLGPLGFLAARPLSSGGLPRTTGNYGLADLIQALVWTNLNIMHFGGDPKSVTVLGYKAGATLATLLTTIRKPHKLFTRAWISTPSTVFPNMTLVESENDSEGYLKSLSCVGEDTAAAECLRLADVEDLLDALPDPWRPIPSGYLPNGTVQGHQWVVQDGNYLRQHPHNYWATNNVTVDLVFGTTIHSEITPEWYFERKNWTVDRISTEVSKSQIGNEGPRLIDKVFQIYNRSLVGLASMTSDIATVCPLYKMHKLVPNSKFYLITQPVDASEDNGLVYGGSDIEVIMGLFPYRTAPQQRRFIATFRNLFYRFVTFGVPPEHKRTSIAQDPAKMDVRDLEMRCLLWQEAGFDKFARLD